MSTPIPTREINLSPADMLGLLRLIELPWRLINCGSPQLAHTTALEVYINGTSTAHTIALRDDGTWTARTHITP